MRQGQVERGRGGRRDLAGDMNMPATGSSFSPFQSTQNVTGIEAGLRSSYSWDYRRGDAKLDKIGVVSSGEDRVRDNFGLFRGC